MSESHESNHATAEADALKGGSAARPAVQGATPPHQSGSGRRSPRHGRRARLRFDWPVVAALVTWVVATPIAFVLPAVADLHPFGERAAAFAIGSSLILVVGVFMAWNRWQQDALAGVAAGVLAAWTVLVLRLALNGTPFGFAGLVGDMGRMSAMATRYTDTLASADPFVADVASEYPLLYPWVIGRTAVLLDIPAWRLLADAEVLTSSAAVLTAFLLWRRLVAPWIALAISALSMTAWSDPRKAFEVISLAVFIPWVIEVFGRPARRPMHWLPAGILGGFVVMTYVGWFLYGIFGMLALLVVTIRTEADRWAYFRRIALTAVVAAIVSSPYLIPYIHARITIGTQTVSDLWVPPAGLMHSLFPFLQLTPLGILQLVGLVGLILLRRSTWWAKPLLVLTLGAYAYRLVFTAYYVLTGHTFLLQYTVRLYTVLFAISGVLVMAHIAPLVARSLRATPPRAVAGALLAIIMAWSATVFVGEWLPGRGGTYATGAHLEPLPDGTYPKYAPDEGRRRWFPVGPIEDAVERVAGKDPRLVTLSVDERLFSYLPWPGYMGIDITASNAVMRWCDRLSEVRRIADIREPEAFARASASTAFGPIDIFILRRAGDSSWRWADAIFKEEQFSPAQWTAIQDLPENIVVIVRRAADPVPKAEWAPLPAEGGVSPECVSWQQGRSAV